MNKTANLSLLCTRSLSDHNLEFASNVGNLKQEQQSAAKTKAGLLILVLCL